jgi:hypothetical protein
VPLVNTAEAIAPPGVESAMLDDLAGPVMSLLARTKNVVRATLGKESS